MEKSSHKDKGALRVNDWWWSKAALLMGMIYLFTLRYSIPLRQFIPLSLLSLTTIVGFASFGYLVNDLFDIEKDAHAGKANFLTGKSITFIAIIFFISIVFISAPWVFLPKNRFSLGLIAIQLLLFALYSISPVRLKERGMAGIITDALYAHSVPVFLAAYTYSLAAGVTFFTPDMIILFLWQFISGVRNIVLHQADDVDADKKSGSRNFISGLSQPQFAGLLKGLIVVDLALCICLFGFLSFYNHLFLICLAAIIVFVFADAIQVKRITWIEFFETSLRYFPNNRYEKWLPPVILCSLTFLNPWFLLVMVLHLTIFNFDFYIQFADKIFGRYKSVSVKGKFITLRIFLSYPINNVLYYAFKVFSVDLKKRNISAGAFLLSKMGIKSTTKMNDQSFKS